MSKNLASGRNFLHDEDAEPGRGRSRRSTPVLPHARFRTYLALAATLAVPAKAALATSAVEVARELEPTVASWTAADEHAFVAPLAIANTLGVIVGPVASRDASVQIELRIPDAPQQSALAFDRQYQVNPPGEAR
jgi:hypothetical protein